MRCLTSTVSATSTAWPGQSTSSAFSACTLTAMAPVCLSTWLSMKAMVAGTGHALRPRHHHLGRGLGGKRAPHGRKLALRQREGHQDRPGLVDGHQRRGILRAHLRAELGGEAAGAAGDGRADGEIVELRLLRFQERPSRGDAGLEPLDRDSAPGRPRPRSRSACRPAPGAAPSVASASRRRRLVLGDVGLGLRDLRLDDAVVEAEQHAALLDQIALA